MASITAARLLSRRGHITGVQTTHARAFFRDCSSPAAQPQNASTARPATVPDTISVHFVDPNLKGPQARTTVSGVPVGSSIVDVAKSNGVDIRAACGQKLQCATCHVILRKTDFDQLNPKGVREETLLDSTFGLTETSRLGCQVRLTSDMDGIECTLPLISDRGSIRMSLTQPRPKIGERPEANGVPAVAPRVDMPYTAYDNGASAKENSDASLKVSELERRLAEQVNLTRRLESELRQHRGPESDITGKFNDAQKKDAVAKTTSDSSGGSQDEDDGDLEKMKKELWEETRVDVSRLRSRVGGFVDVVGLTAAKAALLESIIWPATTHPSLFSGVRGGPCGFLLHGPPGCGKTMLARAAAVELDGYATFFHIRAGDIMSKFYGESQRRIRALEDLVREKAPAVVFLDEVDALLGSRDGGTVAEHHRATTNALLAWMDGFGTGDERVFFLGATNRPESMDEAALRRFGDAAEVGLPEFDARLALFRHLAVVRAASGGHRSELEETDLVWAAEATDGLSLADVERVIRRAFLEVLRRLPEGVPAGLQPQDVPPMTAEHLRACVEAEKKSGGMSFLQRLAREKKAEKQSE